LFEFESKLTVDEVEDELREEQNSHFIEGKAVHSFEELTSILDFMPAGYESDEEQPAKNLDDEGEGDDLPELDAAEEEKLKNDESLKWDEDDEEKDKDDDKDDDDEDDEDKEEDDEKSEESDDDEKPKKKTKGKR
ncbi:MAG: hypothetical protein ABIV50_12800, partial [Opitutus sp.]